MKVYNPKWKLDWKNYGLGNELNYSLINKINEISGTIHRTTMMGGGNEIKMNPKVFSLIKDCEYVRVKDDKITLSNRYVIDVNEKYDPNKVIVLNTKIARIPIILEESGLVYIHEKSKLLEGYKHKKNVKIVTDDMLVGEITIEYINN